MGINECVMCANFGDPRSRDRELRRKKNNKKCDFWFQNLLIRLLLKKHFACTAKLVHNVGDFTVNGLWNPSLGAPGHVTKILLA